MRARPRQARPWFAAVAAAVGLAVAWSPGVVAGDRPTVAADAPSVRAEAVAGAVTSPTGAGVTTATRATTTTTAAVTAPPAPAQPTTDGGSRAFVDEDGLVIEDIVPVANPPKAKKHVRVLVVPVYWSGNPRDSMSTSTLKSLAITKLDRYYREVSRGRYGISGTVVPWTKISSSGLWCSGVESKLLSRAIAAAKKHGYSAAKYDRVEVYHPMCNPYWAGMAMLGDSRGPGHYLVIDGSAYLSVFAHEMGHTFGLDHANAYQCKAGSNRVTLSKSCTAYEYGDGFDTMGATPSGGSFSTPHLVQLKWLTSKQTKVVTKSTSNVRLTPLVGSSSGVKTIRVKASSSRTYWVELREHTGVDGRLTPGGVGVEVRMTDSRVAGGRGGATLLLDLQPQNSWSSVTLPDASAWTSPEGVRISVSRLSATSATVSVKLKAAKPKVPNRPAVTATRGDTTARVTVRRPAGNGSVVQSYTIRAVPAGGGTTVTKKIDAKAAASSATTFTGLTNGKTYAISATARNEKGSSSWSTAVKVTPAALPPVVTLTSPAVGATVTGSSLTVAGTVGRQSGSTATVETIDVEVSQGSGGAGGAFLYGGWTSTHAFSTSLDISALSDGPATVAVTVTDSNNRVTKVTRTFTVAGHSPTLAVDPAPVVGTAAGGFDFAYTATAGSRPLDSMQATLTGPGGYAWSEWWVPESGAAATRHVDLTDWGVEPGAYTLELVLTDWWGTSVTVDLPVTLT